MGLVAAGRALAEEDLGLHYLLYCEPSILGRMQNYLLYRLRPRSSAVAPEAPESRQNLAGS